jgi:hypothetical protein
MSAHDEKPGGATGDVPWQFGLRALLGMTIATAVALTILFSLPDEYAVPVLVFLVIAVPAMLTVTAVYGSGYQRAFCIGALFPTGVVLYGTAWMLISFLFLLRGPRGPGALDGEFWMEFVQYLATPYRAYVGAAWVLAVVLGSLAVMIRWRLEEAKSRS